MENASKALIMAASILLGVMIISVGVALFNSFSSFGKDTAEKFEQSKINEWNSTYLKYYGSNTYVDEDGKEKTKPIQVSAYDIISVTNSAKENNINYELENEAKYNENTYYVQVQVGKQLNFEKLTEQEKSNFLKENSLVNNEIKYYICTEVKISEITKRVIYIKFDEQK